MIDFREAWSVVVRAWRKDQTRFAWMTIGLLASNPVLWFQIVTLLANFSWVGLALLPIGAILGHLAINTGFIAGRLRDAANVLVASQALKRAGVQGYSLSAKEALRRVNTLSYDIADDIEKWFFQMGGLNNLPLDYHIRIHVVPGSGGFTTYTSGPGLPSRIFLSNHPRKGLRQAFQKFYLLHEILHAAAEIQHSALERFSLAIFGVLLLWALPISNWNLLTCIAWAVTLASMALLWRRARCSANLHPVSREIRADAFAIG